MDRNIRISENLANIIEKIREDEEKRTGSKPSWSKASEILYLRIMNVGGLRN